MKNTHEDTMREALDKFEQAIRTHCRSYGSSYSVIDGYEAKVKEAKAELIAALQPRKGGEAHK